MSDTTPRARTEQDEDASGHAFYFVSDPGEIGVESGQGKLPAPGEDDTTGHVFAATGDAAEDDATGHRLALATDDASEDDTEGHRRSEDVLTSDGIEDDTEGHRVMSSTVTDDGTEGMFQK